MIRHYTIVLGILLSFSLLSCNNEKQVKPIQNEVEGKFFKLDDDNIDLFLPKTFEAFSIDEAENKIQKRQDTLQRELAMAKFNQLKFSKGNIYFFEDHSNPIELNVKLLPYFLFSKKDSSQLLGMMSLSCEQFVSNFEGVTCVKLKAGYSGSSKRSIFKAVYKIKLGFLELYQTFYAITSGTKSFMLNFNSYNENINFDPYVEKLIVR